MLLETLLILIPDPLVVSLPTAHVIVVRVVFIGLLSILTGRIGLPIFHAIFVVFNIHTRFKGSIETWMR